MKRNYFLELIGFGYIVNHGTKEIHRVDRITPACGLHYLRNYGYGTRLYALMLIKWFGYNGCCHCFSEKDTD